ncbi:MAG: protein kinase [Streptococcus gallolyticus]|nr:protein kinase [Streptococcus gallolyticus]
MTKIIEEKINKLEHQDAYRVEELLKDSPYEKTELVYFKGETGSELGPFIKKTIKKGGTSIYKQIQQAQKVGMLHEGIPKVVECYDSPEGDICIMESCEGKTLEKWIENREINRYEALVVFRAICEIVNSLHKIQPQIIHRDLKPENILLNKTTDGFWLYLLDFGIARNPKEGAKNDTVLLGTKEYAAPEQYGFAQTDQRSDIYSLGKILYYCLTGNTMETNSTSSYQLTSVIPLEICKVIFKATELDPAKRYQNVDELLNDLDKANNSRTDKFKQILKQSNAKFGFAWNVFLCFVFGIFVFTTFSLIFDAYAEQGLSGADLLSYSISRIAVTFLIIAPALFIVSSKFYIRGKKNIKLLYGIPLGILIFGIIFVAVLSLVI